MDQEQEEFEFYPDAPTLDPQALRVIEFRPWHKPRKQWIRRKWAEELEVIGNDLRGNDQDSVPSLRYLTMPGIEMLDVRHMAKLCREKKFHLKYVGIEKETPKSSDGYWLTISDTELKSKEEVDGSSQILFGYPFEAAANQVLAGKIKENGPYHAINIDLCDCLVALDKQGNPSKIRALGRLIQMQAMHCKHDWLLFIATRARSDIVEETIFNRFTQLIIENAKKNPDFKALILETLELEDIDFDNENCLNKTTLEQPNFIKFFSIAVGKWLLHQFIGTDGNNFAEFLMLESYIYKVSEETDMLSLVYKVKTKGVTVSDPTGLVPSFFTGKAPNQETKLATRIAKKSKELVDIDMEIGNDPSFLNELLEETKSLLREAKVDTSRFEAWARQEDKN